MNTSKIDALLLYGTEASTDLLSRSDSLSFGYDADSLRWEIIVKYIGDFASLAAPFGDSHPTMLLGGYAIFHVTREELFLLSDDPQVIYIEKPKRLFFEDTSAKQISCIPAAANDAAADQAASDGIGSSLTGTGVAIAVIDSGIDYTHPDFRNSEGDTRISYLWDQTVPADHAAGFAPPQGYPLGTLFQTEQINAALSAKSAEERARLCPSIDLFGHGTHVAGIAAGNGRAENGRYRGVAPGSSLWIIKLGSPSKNDFPSTSQLMQAVDFCVRKGLEKSQPLIINLSFGNTYGSHSGTSLLETYLDDVSQMGQITIVIGTGNEAANGGHISGRAADTAPRDIEFSVADYQPNLNLQIWKNYWDDLAFYLRGPSSLSGSARIPLQKEKGFRQYEIGSTTVRVFVGEPSPYSPYQEIYLDFLPNESYIDAGVWTLTVQGHSFRDGSWDIWMPVGSSRNSGTRFLYPTVDTTLTIPSTAARPISVGAYDSASMQAAPFSGRGYTWNRRQIKPDLVAPGVGIISCAPGGGYASRTGTSMATPFVSGSCALLAQWGILLKNDPFLYGEKAKAYLIAGTKKLPFADEYPNPLTGWGALCLRKSFPADI